MSAVHVKRIWSGDASIVKNVGEPGGPVLNPLDMFVERIEDRG